MILNSSSLGVEILKCLFSLIFDEDLIFSLSCRAPLRRDPTGGDRTSEDPTLRTGDDLQLQPQRGEHRPPVFGR